MKNSLPATTILLLTTLACRPVLTIGWGEIAIIFVLLAALLGPPLFRLYRRWHDFKEKTDQT